MILVYGELALVPHPADPLSRLESNRDFVYINPLLYDHEDLKEGYRVMDDRTS